MNTKQFQQLLILLANMDNKLSMLQATINVGLQKQIENKLSDVELEYVNEVLDSQIVYENARKDMGLT